MAKIPPEGVGEGLPAIPRSSTLQGHGNDLVGFLHISLTIANYGKMTLLH